jgi:hypothetical protein
MNLLNRLAFRGDKDSLKRRIYTGMIALSSNRPVAASTHATAAAEIADTGAFFVLQNSGTDTGALIKPLYIRLYTVSAGTNGTDLSAMVSMDAALRYSSAGTALVANNTTKEVLDSAEVTQPTSIANAYAGALVLAAGTNEVDIAYPTLNNGIVVAGDSYTLSFGEGPTNSSAYGTSADSVVAVVPEVTVGPGSSLIVRLYSTSQSAASTFYVEAVWAEVGRAD